MGIRSRTIKRGDPCESSWPSDHGTVEHGFTGHWCRETNKFVEGPPPAREVFSQAPAIITDDMKPTYHHGVCRKIDSKSQWKKIDKALGLSTSDRFEPASKAPLREHRRKLQQDRHEALRRAVAAVDAGEAPLSEEVRAKCAAENERLSNILGVDLFNVAGRKNDKRGKRYRRR